MRRSSISYGALTGLLTSFLVTALSFLGWMLQSLPLVPLDLFDWFSRMLPGPAITAGIDSMVSLIRDLNLGPTDVVAKLIEQLTGVVLLAAAGILFGALLQWVGSRKRSELPVHGAILGLIFALLFLLLEMSLPDRQNPLAAAGWLSLLLGGWGAGLGLLLRGTQNVEEKPGVTGKISRREFLSLFLAAAAGMLVSGFGLAAVRRQSKASLPPSRPLSTGVSPAPLAPSQSPEATSAAPSPTESTLTARIQPAPGTRSEVTPTADFYRIDINTTPPKLDPKDWRLQVDGLVQTPLTLSLEDLQALPPVTQAVTMQCISNPVGGDLTGTTYWTGVPLKTLLERAGMKPEAKGVYITSADGFYEFVYFEDMLDPRTLLVYEMDGAPLPYEHGFPLRIYIPNRYGMKQPKWIIHMEVVDQYRVGYWVQLGWNEQAIAKTTSVIDVIAVKALDSADHSIPVGGIAWAGARGISKVEVQVDDGDWVEAQLRTPTLSPLTWVQWRYDWHAQSGYHRFAVRAYDGTGALQETDTQPPEPNGASGIHTVRVTVNF